MNLPCPKIKNSANFTESLFAQIPQPVVVVGSDVRASVQQINDSGGGTLYFPAGVYDVLFFTGGAINIDNVDGLFICGESKDATTIRMIDSANSVFARMLTAADSANIEIANLSFDGNRSVVQTFPQEQQSAIFTRRVENLYIHDCCFREHNGDGINIGAQNNVLIERVDIDDTDRNGISFGVTSNNSTDITNVVIRDSRFGGGIDTQQIDMEAGSSRIINVEIYRNEFVEMLPEDQVNLDQYAMTISGADNVLAQNNIVDNPVLIRTSSDIEMSLNTKFEQLHIDRESINIRILQNEFQFQLPTTANSAIKENGIMAREVAGNYPDNLVIDSNLFTGVVGDYKVYLQDVANTRITNNDFSGVTSQVGDIWAHAQSVSINLEHASNGGANVSVFEQNGNTVNEQTQVLAAIPVENIAQTPLTLSCVSRSRKP